MEYIVNQNNPYEILKNWENPDGTVCGTHYCWAIKLTVAGLNTTAINTPLPLTIAFQDWQNNPLPSENWPIKVTVSGPGQPAELTLNPVNGQVEFDFESPVAGTFTILATADFPCDPCILEVTVHE